MTPLISCILTSYNQPIWLQQAVQSVLDQSEGNFELFLMDDNSTDERVSNIMQEAAHDSRVHCHTSDVQPQDRMTLCRYSQLINEALSMSSGKYITYLTDDDYYMPTRFELMLNELESDDNIHVVYGTQALQYGDDNIHNFRIANHILDDAYDVVDHNSVMHCRHIYQTVGDWTIDPAHWRGADGQYWRKITKAGYQFYPVNAVTDVHRYHTQSVRHKLLEQGLTDLN